MQEEHRLNHDTLDDKEIQEKLRKIAEENEDVKSGKIKIEDELNEPSYILYGQILKSTTEILRTPDTKALFSTLIEKFGEDTTASLMEFFAAAITQASYNAVIFYDSLLKKELSRNFNLISDPLNKCLADVAAHGAVLESFGKRITALEKNEKIKDLQNEVK